MVNSINTNAGSLLGTRNLQDANKSLANTQNRLNTGRDVSSPRDNAALLSIAQGLIGDIGGLSVVKSSLNRAISSSDVALAGGEQVSDLLLDLKELAVRAADPGLDDASRQILNEDFAAQRDQINSVVESAEFGGTNAIASGGDDISAIVNNDGSESIAIQAQDLSLGGANVTLGASQGIGTQADAAAAVSAIEQSITNVSSSLAQIGSGANQLEATREFTEKLQAVTQEGVSNLVDADLAEVSAQLAADQVRQALSIQTLAISNSQPSSVLSLFGDST
ncbi:MAG: flagellin [Kordiimonadales bacterium]|nr:MAG: flagellin [Kordiimonadales bacterium]